MTAIPAAAAAAAATSQTIRPSTGGTLANAQTQLAGSFSYRFDAPQLHSGLHPVPETVKCSPRIPNMHTRKANLIARLLANLSYYFNGQTP
ncbi:hypothetical protein PoB_001530200 [Plakobranchus ocellatus]|uniref:Uncharacterized protein n=1 Tax=Plakobranchus ocellatus TaxID=259542 RepID=A0AAV3Z2N9_9GAST|nr:hypothetical protein PoB_001530200 [Plakobranchus ocellatus]